MTQAAAPHRLQPGTILQERYLIGNALGQGGFSITYMGRDLKLDMRVAVKEYYPKNGYTNRNAEVTSELTISDKEQADFIGKGKKKFLEEAYKLAQVHENSGVLDVRDFFEANKTAYIVMEFLDGKDLRVVLKERSFTANEIFCIMRPVIDALEKVHALDFETDDDDEKEKDKDEPEQDQKKKALTMAGIAVAAALVIGGATLFAGGGKAKPDAAQETEYFRGCYCQRRR